MAQSVFKNRLRRLVGIAVATVSVSFTFVKDGRGFDFDPKKLPAASQEKVDFDRQIAPVLESRCLRCHSGANPKGKYSLATRELALGSGENAPNIKVGASAASPMIGFVAHCVPDMEMPPKGDGEALSAAQVGLLRGWIDQGMNWPAGRTLKAPATSTKSASASLPPVANRKVDFAKDVLPVFVSQCFACHGAKRAEMGLRLDNRELALAGGENGPVILPGHSDTSKLIHLVAGVGGSRMPKKGDPLSAQTVGILRAWIDQGAVWPDDGSAKIQDRRDHWGFQTPKRPKVPVVRGTTWPAGPVDQFILARLEKEGLAPAQPADRITLLRRLSLDLIGLPPTVAEIDGFWADSRPDAYARQVERLLASPHFGERWARHWLDAARYADSDGYEKDKSRSVWFYRDYVINAFNRDLPYNQFLIEQLAGDLLPQPSQDQIVATGFLRHSMLNEEGGVDPEQFRMDAMFDRMDAIGKSILGLTIQCAQCHSHKFDPLTQEEYYQLFAYLNSDHEPSLVVYTPEELRLRDNLRQKMRALEDDWKSKNPDWRERMAKWESHLKQAKWVVLHPSKDDCETGGQKYIPQGDGSVVAQGYAPTKFATDFTIPTELKEIRAFRLELLTDPNLPANGPGRSFQGTSALTEFRAEIADRKSPDKKQAVKLASAAADYANPERPLEANFFDKSDKKRVTGPIGFAIDGKDETAWGIDAGPGRRNTDRTAVFVIEKPTAFANGTIVSLHLVQNHGGWNSDDHMNNNLGRFRLSATETDGAASDVLPRGIREIVNTPAQRRSSAQGEALFTYWRTHSPEMQSLNEAIESLWKQWPAGAQTLALKARETPRPTRMLKRGDFLKPGKEVRAGTPKFLHPLRSEDTDPSRLTFARWVADERSPTTARVFVNRVWQYVFGTGIVATPEDFGTQAETPSHPELLDWLAVEFMEKGWSLKRLLREIVTSRTYQQSSVVTPRAFEKDPYNRLLGRGARYRVEGEIVRDIALAASGLLDAKVGGESLFSPAPAFLFQPPASYGPFTWTEVTDSRRYRRALYTFRRRSTPYPMLTNFDVPNADAACVRRSRSNTPLQALTTLNEVVFVECSRQLGKKMMDEGGATDAERLTYAFRRCVGRAPTVEEVSDLKGLLEKQRRRLAAGELHAAELATGSKESKGNELASLAAYVTVARVLLNLDETITRE